MAIAAPVNNEIKQLAAHCRLHDHVNKTAVFIHLQTSPASGLLPAAPLLVSDTVRELLVQPALLVTSADSVHYRHTQDGICCEAVHHGERASWMPAMLGCAETMFRISISRRTMLMSKSGWCFEMDLIAKLRPVRRHDAKQTLPNLPLPSSRSSLYVV